MDKKTEALITILAASDARFKPCRRTGPGAIAFFEQRELFGKAGIPWSSTRLGVSGTDAGRKGAQRLLRALGIAEEVEVRNPTGHRTVTARLTPSGDAKARSICDLPSLFGALIVVDAIHALSADRRTYRRAGVAWVRETVVTNSEYGESGTGGKLVELQEQLLPALVAGYADSNADAEGRVWYSLTPAGMDLAGQRLKAKPPRASGEKPIKGAQDLYADLREAEEAALQNSRALNSGEIGSLPMPVGV